MKKLLLAVSLVFLVSPAMADRWEYEGETYKPYVNCTSDTERRSMKWVDAIPPYDKAIFYEFKMLNWKGEVESIRTALLQWTKPKINPSTGKIQMTMNAKPLEGNTAAKLTYQGGIDGGRDWGFGANANANRNIPLQGQQHWFKLNTSGPEDSQQYTISISVTGGCRSVNVAVYGFSRVKEFIDDFSSSSDSGVEGKWNNTIHIHSGCKPKRNICKRYEVPLVFSRDGFGNTIAKWPGFSLQGTLSNTTYEFKMYHGSEHHGKGIFNFDSGYRKFSGTWEDNYGHKGTWTGKR